MSDFSLSFDHVHLLSEDPQSVASWYVDKLGAKIAASGETRGAPSIRVDLGGSTIVIRGRRAGEELDKKRALHWGTDHFGFNVTGDFNGFCDDLKKKGVPFTVDPVDFSPTTRLAFIEAPDGVIIELLQRNA